MAYSKTDWVNDSTPYINAGNLNKIEQGIYDNSISADNIGTSTSASGTATTTSSTASWQQICRVTLNTGRYLVLCKATSSISDGSLYVSARYTIVSTAKISLLAGGGQFRGTMRGGGGLTGWAFVNVTGDDARLDLEGYVTNEYDITGQLCAIRLK